MGRGIHNLYALHLKPWSHFVESVYPAQKTLPVRVVRVHPVVATVPVNP